MKLPSYVLILATPLLTACAGGEANDPDPPAAADQVGAEVAADPDLRTMVMTVPSMSCPLCVRSIRVRLEEAGLENIRIDLQTKLVQARFDPGRMTAADVEALVEGQGFPVEESRVLEPDDDPDGGGPS